MQWRIISVVKVRYTGRREYGAGILDVTNGSQLFDGLGAQVDVWNSHGDEVTALPEWISCRGANKRLTFRGGRRSGKRRLYGLQFHPEVAHTPRGREILQNFVYHICHCTNGLDNGFVHRGRLPKSTFSSRATTK